MARKSSCDRSLLSVLVPVLIASSVVTIGCSSPAPAPEPEPGSVNPEVWPQLTMPIAEDPALEAEITELMARMSLEEKVGQVIQGEIRYTTPEDVRTYHLGSVLNGGGSHPNDRSCPSS